MTGIGNILLKITEYTSANNLVLQIKIEYSPLVKDSCDQFNHGITTGSCTLDHLVVVNFGLDIICRIANVSYH